MRTRLHAMDTSLNTHSGGDTVIISTPVTCFLLRDCLIRKAIGCGLKGRQRGTLATAGRSDDLAAQRRKLV